MKIVDKINRKYFPYKVKLIPGEYRECLTELDKAFIHACIKLGIQSNRRGWFGDFDDYEYFTNKYDFFKFNFKVQSKCMNSGHLKELIYGMTLKLANTPSFWITCFKFMKLFDEKSGKLPIFVYTEAISVATVIDTRLGLCLRRVLRFYFPILLGCLGGRVTFAFEDYFEFEQSKSSENDLRIKYLKVLGVSSNASNQEIKIAYKKLVLKYHPDRGGNAENFKEIVEAYNYLIND